MMIMVAAVAAAVMEVVMEAVVMAEAAVLAEDTEVAAVV